MSIRNLDHLFRPGSVALIGASQRPGSLGNILARNLCRGGFKGPLWLVNPKGGTIEGRAVHAGIAGLPDAPDLAVIATPPATVPGLIAQLAAKGTRAAVVITAGIHGELKQAMLDAAKPSLLRIQGPNCLGLMLPRIGLDATFAHCMAPAGDLALVSQSGALITGIVDWAVGRGVGFSHIVSLGDMADADFGDLLDYLAGDTQSRAILLYMEALTQAAKFMSAARRAARAKPVIVIKAGRHAEGAKAAMSHTGALAGSDAAYAAAFRRAGIVRVNELEDLFNAAEILSRSPRLEGERLMILTNGGGAGVLAADRLADLDGRLAELPAASVTSLDTVLPATWSHGNPVDIIGDADAGRYAKALDILLGTSTADAVLVMNCPTALASSTEIARTVAETASAVAKRGSSKPLLACWLGDDAARAGRGVLAERGIATFATPAAAVEGFMQLVSYRRAQDELMRTPEQHAELAPVDRERARAVIAAGLARPTGLLSEDEAKELLACHGIPVVPTRIAPTPATVHAIAGEILAREKACVVKILSDDITHKSDVGGVRLGLESVAAAAQAAEEMLARIRKQQPTARIRGFTVQPMIRRPRAHELIVGMTDDATFGPMLMFGAGGTAVEVMRDTAMSLLPLDRSLARDLMRQTRINRLLEGYRDRPAADLEAIVTVIVRLGELVVTHPEIREIDINPLLADESGALALDARVRVESSKLDQRRPLSIRPYPSQWRQDLSIDGVGAVTIRPIKPEDEWLYARFVERLAPEDMRMRFFIARPHLSHQLIARLTQIDYAREMAFAAIDGQGRLVGVSRLASDPDKLRAEFAVIVASDLKGRGLGWRLMQQLIAYARAEAIGEITGDVLAENATMLGMCRELGFRIEPDADDPALRRATLAL